MPPIGSTRVLFVLFYSLSGGASFFFLAFTLSPAQIPPILGRSLSLCPKDVGNRGNKFFQKNTTRRRRCGDYFVKPEA